MSRNDDDGPIRAYAPIIDIGPNPARGRDLVFGDIHGCFGTVAHALDALGYDADRDRLFSVGDLVDHGVRSEEALEWMQSRFTAVVRGNHEQMMLDWLWFGARMSNPGGAWRSHWASWWFPMSRSRETRIAWARAMWALPFAATVRTEGGPVGLVHGAVNETWSDWTALCAALEHSKDVDNPTFANDAAHRALWNRPAERHPTPGETTRPEFGGVRAMIHGHDPGPAPGWTAPNTLCIDTGVHWEELGHLTVAEIQTGHPELHRFARTQNDSLLEPPPRPADLWSHGQGSNRSAFIAAMGTHEHPMSLGAEHFEGTLKLEAVREIE